MLEINELGYSTYIEWGDPDRFFGGIALFKAGIYRRQNARGKGKEN